MMIFIFSSVSGRPVLLSVKKPFDLAIVVANIHRAGDLVN